MVTPHMLASRAAATIMKQGGNAADAAIAANATLGVVAPETCGVGGDLFALVHVPGGGAPAESAPPRGATFQALTSVYQRSLYSRLSMSMETSSS